MRALALPMSGGQVLSDSSMARSSLIFWCFLRNIPETDVVPEALEPDGDPVLILPGTQELSLLFLTVISGIPRDNSQATNCQLQPLHQ